MALMGVSGCNVLFNVTKIFWSWNTLYNLLWWYLLSTCSAYDSGGHLGAARSLQKHHFSWKLRVFSFWASSCSFCISLKSEGPLDNPTSFCAVIWQFFGPQNRLLIIYLYYSILNPSGRRLMQASIPPCESSKIYFTSLHKLDSVLRWSPCTQHVLLFESMQ